MQRDSIFDQALQKQNNGVQISELSGRIVYLNDMAMKRLGIENYETKEFYVKDFEPLFTDADKWGEHIRELKKMGSLTIHSENINQANGERIPVEVNVQIIEHNNLEYVLAITQDISDRKLYEDKLQIREKMLIAIAESTKELLFSNNVRQAIHEVLPIIGAAVNVDRTYLFSVETHPEFGEVVSQQFEWNSGSADPQIDNPDLQNVPAELFADFMELIRQNKPFQAIVSELPEGLPLRETLEPQQIVSILIIPVFLKNELYGFVGYDDCYKKRVWDESELSILQTLANNISVALEREIQRNEIDNLALFPLQNPSPILRISEKLEVLLKNDSAEKLFSTKLKLNGKETILLEILENISNELNESHNQTTFTIETDKKVFYTVTAMLISEKKYINFYFNDISLLKETQEVLARTRQTTEEIVSNMEDVIWSARLPDMTPLFISSSTDKLYGISAEEFKKDISIWEQLIVDEDKAIIAQIYKEIEESGYSETEYRINTPQGIKWINNRSKLITDEEGKPIRIDGYVRDISRQKLYEEQFRFQEEKYRRIIANMNLGLIEVDLDDRIVYANESFAEMSGYSAEELIGHRASELFLPKERQKIIQEKFDDRVKGKMDTFEIEVHDKHKSAKWWLVSGAPNLDQSGEMVGTVGIHLDITNQKATLEELKKAKFAAEASNKAKEEFIMNMSHEIRTPLNAIVGLSNYLKNQPLPDEETNLLEKIAFSGKYLQTLIDNILDFSKISSGHLELRKETFNIAHLIESLKHIIDPLAKEKNLPFMLKLDEHIPLYLKGDETRLRQVLVNILSNAVKFTNEGRIELELTHKHVSDDEAIVSICIKDTGIGMSAEFQKRLFEKFAQEEHPNEIKTKGTGLGMAISNEFIKLMGGKITVNSIKGLGSEFTITLPMQVSHAVIGTKKYNETRSKSLEGINILLVEDNEINRLVGRTILEKLKATIVEAENGLIALDILQSRSIDCVLMDIQMPVMDGLESTQHIRNKLKLDTPIIALSANALNTEIDKCMEIGMNDYIVKPFDENQLVESIHRHIHKMENQHKNRDLIATETAPNSDIETLYDLSKLEVISDGNEQFKQEIVQLFCSIIPEELAKLKQAIDEKEIPIIKQVAHKIKPNFANFGITAVRDDILFLNNIKDHQVDWKQISHSFEAINRTAFAVINALKN